VCSRANMGWRGVWRTPHMSMQSECDCEGRAADNGPGRDHRGPSWDHRGPGWGHGGGFASGGGNSCRAHAVRQCRGCSVTCRPDQTAHCREGSVGIFTGPNDSLCGHEAKCECR
jgi:hypothetical protein